MIKFFSSELTSRKGENGYFTCKPPPPSGSQEPCLITMTCPCGEYCDPHLKICLPALCTRGTKFTKLIWPNFQRCLFLKIRRLVT